MILMGNMHSVTEYLNKHGLGEYLVQIYYGGGYSSIVILRLPEDLLKAFQEREIL